MHASCNVPESCPQVLYLVLHGLKRGLAVPGWENVCVPHGAETGFDPYQAYDNIDDESVYGYLHGHILPRGSPGEWVSCLLACTVLCCVQRVYDGAALPCCGERPGELLPRELY